ncbi:MAG TPA: VWA domain-containing protein [Candidatus Acidoferrales bacterium]|nr:VWA domain-containing protein [Candidatus Acidoferrales bacterium]
MKRLRLLSARTLLLAGIVWLAFAELGRAQAPVGPIAPKPGTPVQQAPKNEQGKIKVRVTLVSTPVTVRDGSGEMVTSLNATDFHVLDNGVEQTISHFDVGGDPLSLVLVIETSSRIQAILPAIRKTGIVFTQTVMGPTGEAAVLGFNDSVDKLADFTSDADRIEKTVGSLRMGTSGTRLYDALSTAVEMLTSRPEAGSGSPDKSPGRRRVILALSEATDSGSQMKLGEVLHQTQLANVTIYTVGLSTTSAELRAEPKQVAPQLSPPGTFPRPPLAGTPQTPTTEAQRDANIDILAAAVWAIQHIHNEVKDHALEVATTATGGAHLSTFKDRSIEKAMDQIGGELHAQYTISFSPAGTDPTGYHEIKVEVSRPGLKVRARPGYYLPPPAS